MKKLKSLEFVEILSKNDQQMVFGGLSNEIGEGACERGLACNSNDECEHCDCIDDPIHGKECR